MKAVVSSIAGVVVALVGMSQAVGEGCSRGKGAGDCVRPRSPIDEIACPHAKALKDKIGICDLNSLASEQADKCLVAARTQKDAVIAALTAMIAMTDRETMRASLKLSAADISVIQDEANRVAGYTEAMIDFPGSRGPETSPPCFNQNFDRVQSVVDKMDSAIAEASSKFDEAKKVLKKQQPRAN